MGLTQEFEAAYWSLGQLVLGIDEAGRGPMAGPVVVCGVIFPIGFDHDEIMDSKTLSAKKRDALVQLILKEALWTKTVVVSAQEIDASNIYKVTQDAMEQIANESHASYVLTDAMPLLKCNKSHEAIIKGDQRSLSIAAASILAKTQRDAMMIAYDLEYPQYGFKNHKGYGTKGHKEMILKYGRCPIHRKTFKFKDEDQISLDI